MESKNIKNQAFAQAKLLTECGRVWGLKGLKGLRRLMGLMGLKGLKGLKSFTGRDAMPRVSMVDLED